MVSARGSAHGQEQPSALEVWEPGQLLSRWRSSCARVVAQARTYSEWPTGVPNTSLKLFDEFVPCPPPGSLAGRFHGPGEPFGGRPALEPERGSGSAPNGNAAVGTLLLTPRLPAGLDSGRKRAFVVRGCRRRPRALRAGRFSRAVNHRFALWRLAAGSGGPSGHLPRPCSPGACSHTAPHRDRAAAGPQHCAPTRTRGLRGRQHVPGTGQLPRTDSSASLGPAALCASIFVRLGRAPAWTARLLRGPQQAQPVALLKRSGPGQQQGASLRPSLVRPGKQHARRQQKEFPGAASGESHGSPTGSLDSRMRVRAATSALRTAPRMKGGTSCRVGTGRRTSALRSTPSRVAQASSGSTATSTRCEHSSRVRVVGTSAGLWASPARLRPRPRPRPRRPRPRLGAGDGGP